MIVDAHVSLDRHHFPIEDALRILGEASIGQAVVFADPRSDDIELGNRYVLEVARANNYFPFFYVGGNPYTDTRDDPLELPDNVDDYDGIRWHRWIGAGIDRDGILNNDELDWSIALMESSEFEAFAAAASHYGMPVIFEESLAVTIEFALRYPSLDIIVPHLGARSGGEAKVLRALWDTPNVYFDTSLSFLDETALARVGTERILFGSATPLSDPEQEIGKIDRLSVPEDAKERIYGDNILSLLGAEGMERPRSNLWLRDDAW